MAKQRQQQQPQPAPVATEPVNALLSELVTELANAATTESEPTPEVLDEAALDAAVNQVPMLAEEYPALAQVYENIPQEVIEKCEQARKEVRELRDTYLYALKQVHKALAPYGRFKEWCAAVGLNYGSVKNRLSREESKERDNSELPARLAAEWNGPADVLVAHRAQPAKSTRRRGTGYQDKALKKVALEFLPDDYERVEAGLQRVMDSQRLESREEALLYILDVYEARLPADTDTDTDTADVAAVDVAAADEAVLATPETPGAEEATI